MGRYYSSTYANDGYAGGMLFYSNIVYGYSEADRGQGLSVRCVAEF
ncbi:MAG: hypothetical protein LBB53_03460 [Prevotellaceae bacterium]|nr:hypothetical protein [Prevotellaceae bacterium]